MGLNVYMDSGRKYRFPDSTYYYVDDEHIKVYDEKGGDIIARVGMSNIECVSFEGKNIEVEDINNNIR